MRRFFLMALTASAVLVLSAAQAKALRIALPNASTTQKVLAADAVLVGKVSSVEKETVDLEPFPNAKTKVPHTVVNVKIETALYGAKNVTHVKIVTQKPGEQGNGGIDIGPGGPGGGIRPLPAPFPGRGVQSVQLSEGQEGIFFLSKHPTEKGYYTIQQGHNPLLSTDNNYKDELTKVKAMSVAFADPEKALKAEKIEDRVQSAIALAFKYRQYPQNNTTGVLAEEPASKEISDAMLKVLAEADWTKTDAPKLADALGLVPGQFGIPEIYPGESEDLTSVREKSFKAWKEKYGAKFTVTKLSAKNK